MLVFVFLEHALPAGTMVKANTNPKSTTLSAPPRVAPAEAAALKAEELGVVQTLARDFPNSVEPIVLMGNVQHRHGNATEALAIWQRALKRATGRRSSRAVRDCVCGS